MLHESTRNIAVQRDEIYKRAAARYHNAHVQPSGIQAGIGSYGKTNSVTRNLAGSWMRYWKPLIGS